jgi:hypothetical protein
MGRERERASDEESATSSDIYSQAAEHRDYGDDLVRRWSFLMILDGGTSFFAFCVNSPWPLFSHHGDLGRRVASFPWKLAIRVKKVEKRGTP